MDKPALNVQILSQLLLMQNVMASLPDEKAITDFACRGLEDVPGLSSVRYSDIREYPDDQHNMAIPLSANGAFRGHLILTVSDPAAFALYRDYVFNFCSMLAHILTERSILRQNEEYQAKLEEMVQERTGELQKQIDETKRGEEALRQASERWRKTFDSMLDPVAFLSPEGNVEQYNRAFAEFCGWNIKTLKGHKCYALIHHANDHIPGCPFVKALKSRNRETMELESGDNVLFIVAEPVVSADGQLTGVVHIIRDITDQKHDKAALEASMERYRMVAEAAHDYILTTNLDHRVTFANKAVSDLMGGIDPIGLKVSDFTPPENRAKQEELMNKRRAGVSDIFSFEWKIMDARGRLLIMDVRSQLLTQEDRPSGVLFVARDITERVQTAERLRILNERYELAAMAAGIGVWDRDLKTGEVIWDDRMYDLYGVSRDQFDVTPDTWRDMIHSDDVLQVDHDFQILMRNNEYSDTEFRIRCPDGQIRHLKSYGMVQLDDKGHPARIIGVNYDITWRKQAEEERLKLEKQLFEAQKMEAVGTLAGGIAHDFNNILAAIMGYAELVLETKTENLRARNIQRLLMAAGRAKDLVNQILAFSRHTEHNQKPLDMRNIIKEETKLLRATMPTNIDIRQNIPNTPFTVLADVTQMHQIIMNLCTNAAHAMGAKGGTLDISLSKETIMEDTPDDLLHLNPGLYVRLCISDTGQGIPPDILDRIFEPFFTTKKIGEGTGLGLSVVYGIVKNHRGGIRVASKPLNGAAFYIYLPCVEEATETEASSDKDIIPRGRERILFVDDEKDLTDLAKAILTRLGYRVTTCQDSRQALDIFKTDPDGFDLIITDMTMPHLSGSDLAQEVIRLRPQQSIILCTGFSSFIDAEKASQIGIKTFLAKPITKRDLAIAVRKTLDDSLKTGALH